MAETLKAAQDQGLAPWDDVYVDETKFVIFRDRFPVTNGHLLFVPKVNYIDSILECYRAAHRYGEWMVINGTAQGYNVGINQGEAAGQTVMYPHVHLIPRRVGDCADPVGGVRGVIAGQANYRTDLYTIPD